jgi:hypothetical protein
MRMPLPAEQEECYKKVRCDQGSVHGLRILDLVFNFLLAMILVYSQVLFSL